MVIDLIFIENGGLRVELWPASVKRFSTNLVITRIVRGGSFLERRWRGEGGGGEGSKGGKTEATKSLYGGTGISVRWPESLFRFAFGRISGKFDRGFW